MQSLPNFGGYRIFSPEKSVLLTYFFFFFSFFFCISYILVRYGENNLNAISSIFKIFVYVICILHIDVFFNFYQSVQVDFDGIHLALISGYQAENPAPYHGLLYNISLETLLYNQGFQPTCTVYTSLTLSGCGFVHHFLLVSDEYLDFHLFKDQYLHLMSLLSLISQIFC